MEVLTKVLQKQFDKMCSTGKLFRVNVEGDLIWTAYMYGFGKDSIYRSSLSSVHNCNYCHGFIRRYGNVVAIDPKTYQTISLFDIDPAEVPDEYKKSIADMAKEVHAGEVKDVFVETYSFLSDPKTPYEPGCKSNQSAYKVGVERNIKRYTKEEAEMYPNAGIKPNQTVVFNHFFLTVPKQFIDFSGRSREDLMSVPRQAKDVFKRGLDEISTDTMQLILDLEAQGSLLNGASYKHTIQKALKYAEEYKNIAGDIKNNYAWLKSLEWGPACGFRNTAIGQLMIELSEGKEINAACESFNKMVDPVNYRVAKAPITQRQIADAQKFVEENGFEDSFDRRVATIDDIKVSEILHANQDAAATKTKISVFDGMKATTPTRHKRSEFDKVETVSIEKFMSDILPGCSSVELYLSGKHRNNFMTLLTSVNKDSKRIFKWDNNFSWTYTGNLAGKSQIKQAVKAAGGFVDAPFRCSMLWNEKGDAPSCDLDLHCKEVNAGDEIYYGNHNIHKNLGGISRACSRNGGVIDIDITRPAEQCGSSPAVENIFYQNISTVKDGKYCFFIHNYNSGSNQGVKAEIYILGQTFQYEVKHKVSSDIQIANVFIKNGALEKIEHGKYFVGEGEEQPDNIFGLDTCQFHKVNLVCLSPNFWDGQKGIGNKHYFFCLQGAKSPEKIRSIHNEFLSDDLMKHRKVMEVLGAKLQVESTDGQLSGLGFNATVRDEVILRLGGSFKRVIKVTF